MKVTIFSGGSGSDALQEGLYRRFKELDITIITNGYDNGLSTGKIRTVFNGEILGPSDIRKNQTRHYRLVHGEDSVYRFIEHRFTSDNPLSYIERYYKELKSEKLDKFFAIVKEYFEMVPEASNIEYVDFSIGNIIYGYLAHKFGNSMQAAADYMKELLDIPQTTVLNSDESLFLQAITESGKIIYDEADIVDYANPNNKIKDIRFLDTDNNVKEESFFNQRAIDAVNSADLIIFSTGTQWSSLIPTYKCNTATGQTFAEIINGAKAKKIMIMNGKPDKDMYGLKGDDVLDIVGRYIDIDNVDILSGITAIRPVRYKAEILDLTHSKEGFPSESYNAERLATSLLWLYFGKPDENDTFIFDWDDTIQGRKGSYKQYFEHNKELIFIFLNESNRFIVTGNSKHKVEMNSTTIYADGGANRYIKNEVQTIAKDVEIPNELYDTVSSFLKQYGFNVSMLQNRGNVCLSIKPVAIGYRKCLIDLLKDKIPEDFNIFESGNTTIDIMHKNNNKLQAVKDIIKDVPKYRKVFYVGDEVEEGNDKIVADNKEELGITVISVRNPLETNLFLKSINRNFDR